MPVVLPFTLVAGTKAKASQVMADLNALVAKFTEGAGGVVDADCATNMDLNSAAKLSSTAGKRITNAKVEDDAIDGRTLKKDPGAGAVNAAVNDLRHVKDGLLTKAKLSTVAGTQVALAQLDITIEEVAWVTGYGVGVFGGLTVVRKTVGANYVADVRPVQDSGTGAGNYAALTVTPTIAIPTATRKLLAVYAADVALAGFLSGKVVFISIPNS